MIIFKQKDLHIRPKTGQYNTLVRSAYQMALTMIRQIIKHNKAHYIKDYYIETFSPHPHQKS